MKKQIAWLEDRHSFWHWHLDQWAKEFNIEVQCPSYEYELNATNRAGSYHRKRHHIVYVLPYIVTEGMDAYDKTVAHEMVHAFQYRVMPNCATHGDFFLHVLRNVCKYPGAQATHCYNVSKARKVSKYLKLADKILKLKERS